MAALAGMLVERGFSVTGSDNQLYEPTLSLLKNSRVELMTGFSPANLSPLPDLTVVGNVIVPTNPEAVALLATQVLEFIRDGRSVAELMDLGRRILGRGDVLDGVADMIDEVQVEGTFPDGTKLVTVHHPIVVERGDSGQTCCGEHICPNVIDDMFQAAQHAAGPEQAGLLVARLSKTYEFHTLFPLHINSTTHRQ